MIIITATKKTRGTFHCPTRAGAVYVTERLHIKKRTQQNNAALTLNCRNCCWIQWLKVLCAINCGPYQGCI